MRNHFAICLDYKSQIKCMTQIPKKNVLGQLDSHTTHDCGNTKQMRRILPTRSF
jgi:hypothetical protein